MSRTSNNDSEDGIIDVWDLYHPEWVMSDEETEVSTDNNKNISCMKDLTQLGDMRRLI